MRWSVLVPPYPAPFPPIPEEELYWVTVIVNCYNDTCDTQFTAIGLGLQINQNIFSQPTLLEANIGTVAECELLFTTVA